MREVDTRALESVAKSMGIGNPATVVLPVTFDDDHLQQAYDVGRLIQYTAAKNFAVGDGWVQLFIQQVQNGGGIATTTVDILPQMVADNPGLYQPSDILWLYSGGAYVASTGDAADINQASISLRYPDDQTYLYVGAAAHSQLWWYGEAPAYLTTTAQCTIHGYSANSTNPYPLPSGGLITVSVQNGGIANTTTTFVILARVLPRGVLPGV